MTSRRYILAVVLAGSTAAPPTPARAPDGASATITIAFVGDLMFDRTPGREVERGGDPFAAVSGVLATADLVVGNLECVVATRGVEVDKAFVFRAHPRVIPHLRRHFDALSLANNHTGDFGPGALVEMLGRLQKADIPGFGAGRNLDAARSPLLVRRNGITLALLGYNEFPPRSFAAGPDHPGVAWSVDELVLKDIRAARAWADVVIPFLHWGTEYEPEPDARQRELARRMIDAGAAAVIGSHPHVTQGLETYRGRPIVYSLGNFVFDDFVDVSDDPATIEASRRGWILRLTADRRGMSAWDTIETRTDDRGFPVPLTGGTTRPTAGPDQLDAMGDTRFEQSRLTGERVVSPEWVAVAMDQSGAKRVIAAATLYGIGPTHPPLRMKSTGSRSPRSRGCSERGRTIMTHGAVVAREYGISAAVGLDGTTGLIADGARIRVNGAHEYVEGPGDRHAEQGASRVANER